MADLQKEYKLYVLLTRTGTSVSKLINFATKAPMTHSSICIDPAFSEFYSFGRYHPRFVLPGGFIRETLSTGVFGRCPNAPCTLLEVSVNRACYDAVKERIDRLKKERARYDVPGVLYNYRGIERNHPKNYICSGFVAETLALSGAITPKKHPSLYRPVDFLTHKEFKLLYSGTIEGLDSTIASGALGTAPASAALC